jgi:tryptophan synthase alpha chain
MFAGLKSGGEGALITFVTLGDPSAKQSERIIRKLIDSGADALELGLAFSDPIADGPVIQAADERALKAGMDVDRAFSIIRRIRAAKPDIPIGLLAYCNIVYNYGIGKFYRKMKQTGIDSLLIADLSFEESAPYAEEARKNKVKQVFIVAPTTPEKRIGRIAGKAGGFIYLVSVAGITGVRKKVGKESLALIRRARRATKMPLCVGFGISRPEHVKLMLRAGADGAIVGSAIVNLISSNLGREKKMLGEISSFVKSLKAATGGGKRNK